MSDPLTLHEFSSSYWLVEGLFVEPDERSSVPKINERVYAQIQHHYYENRPTPILFKLVEAGYHFEVHPSESVQAGTVEMPFEIADDLDISPFPSESQFLLSKPHYSHALYRLAPESHTIEG
jgi:hypothetical protein